MKRTIHIFTLCLFYTFIQGQVKGNLVAASINSNDNWRISNEDPIDLEYQNSYTLHYRPNNVDASIQDNDYASKLKTIDQTIESLYGVISGGKNEARDWDFLRYLFHPEAKLIASGKRKDGSIGARYLSIEDYIESSGQWMLENGFYEREMKREVQQFGHIAQVFSSYECFHSLEEEKPFMRGINSIQLMYTGNRWQVMNVYFTQESEDNPIPEKYDKH
jgi:hypothetical protein